MTRRRKKRGGVFMTLFVFFTATAITTVSIYASDSLRVPGTSLIAGVFSGTKSDSRCAPDMIFVDTDSGGYCIDRYEASPAKNCPRNTISGSLDTELNITSPLCVPESAPGRDPWVYVAVHQAESLCARVGKRLPSNREWYRAGIGTPDSGDSCVIGRVGADKAAKTGSANCLSSSGVSDMIGNVWEWVGESVSDGALAVPLPQEGYISEINDQGVPTRTATSSDLAFNEDYFFIERTGTRGIFRGGFWSMEEKAGIYTMNVTMSPSFQGGAVGFRCAQSARPKS